MAKQKMRKEPRHIFRFKIEDPVQGKKVISIPVKTRKAKQRVELTLKAEHVRASIKAHGVGNTATCTAAICVKSQAEAFPHSVDGYVDWTYSRAYVVSKTKGNMPSECIVYRHRDDVAHLNDSPGGQRKLLKMLEKDGERTLVLEPLKRQRGQVGGGRPRNVDGSRSGRPAGQGAKLRYAVAQLGGVDIA